MGIKNYIKNQIEGLTGLIILNSLPYGVDPFIDIQRLIKNYNFGTFIDVGANTGQEALYILKKFPKTILHCIEPQIETFRILNENLGKCENIFCHHVAIGDKNGELILFQGEDDPSMCRLINKDRAHEDIDQLNEKISLITLDEFCDVNNIGHINYLKIDTEGYDLNVLKGTERLHRCKSIDFIEVEAGMNPRNKYHVPFFDLKDFLEEREYLMFGFYDQVHEWIDKKPFLRRSNAVFISGRLADITC